MSRDECLSVKNSLKIMNFIISKRCGTDNTFICLNVFLTHALVRGIMHEILYLISRVSVYLDFC